MTENDQVKKQIETYYGFTSKATEEVSEKVAELEKDFMNIDSSYSSLVQLDFIILAAHQGIFKFEVYFHLLYTIW